MAKSANEEERRKEASKQASKKERKWRNEEAGVAEMGE
jgi:hypothetical protein